MRSRRIRGSKITLKDLIDKNLISLPMTIRKEYYFKKYEAKIIKEGKVVFLGEVFNSLSTPASLIRLKKLGKPEDRTYPSTDGWIFWKYFDKEEKEWVIIDKLRKKYQNLYKY